MKHILFDLFLVSLGSGIGVVTMCLVRAGSQFDRDMETWKRVLQTKVNSQKEKSPAKFARPKKGITKQAGEKMYRQPGWNWQLA